jgi:predicted NUDIX family NTP pyrophosphohydrolase
MKTSAGILMYKIKDDCQLFVLLAHPGGPFWAGKNKNAWGIPKGEYTTEHPKTAALREFEEEIGVTIPEEDLIQLGEIKQSAAKKVTAWAYRGDLDPASIKSNTFTLEWPPKSGKIIEFPEVDQVQWFEVTDALKYFVLEGQQPFITTLVGILRKSKLCIETNWGEKARKIGFTGTSMGMTPQQKIEVAGKLKKLYDEGFNELHYGLCIGADQQAAIFAKKLGYRVVAHPGVNKKNPTNTLFRSDFADNDEVREPKFFIARDRDIVDETELMIAAPNTREERVRSGTWATVRYARKQNREVILILPEEIICA